MKSLILCLITILSSSMYSFAQISSIVPMGGNDIPKYSKFEAGIQLDSLFTNTIMNPYDSDEIRIEAEFTSPSGIITTRDVFYTVPYNRIDIPPYWVIESTDFPYRVRFSPDEIGQWTYNAKIYRNGLFLSSSESYTLNCSDSSNQGHLRVSDNKRYLEFSDGSSFFGIAEDFRATNNSNPSFFGGQCSPNQGECENWCYSPNTLNNDLKLLKDFKNNGGNLVRIWMEAYSYDIEWEKLGDYSTRQNRAHDLDLLIAKAEELGVYIHLVLYNEQHLKIQNCNNEVACWQDNPYNKFLLNSSVPDAFFTNQQALEIYKNKLAYIHARWGYSTSIKSYGLINEPEFLCDYWENISGRNKIHNWLLENSSFLKTKKPEKLIGVDWGSASTAMADVINSNTIDLVISHHYELDKNIEYQRNYDVQEKLSAFDKPFTVNEFGFRLGSCWVSELGTMPDTRETHIHNTIWSSTFSGSYSNYHFFGSQVKYDSPCWGGDKIKKYIPLSKFLDGESFNDIGKTYKPISNALSYYNSYSPPPLNNPEAYGDLPIFDKGGVADKRTNNFSKALLTRGISTSNDRNIQVFGLRKSDKIIGWIGNKNHYWFNVRHYVAQGCPATFPGTVHEDFLNPNVNDQNQSDYTPLIGETFTVDDLECSGLYKIQWFSTYENYDIDNNGISDDGGEIPSLTKYATAMNGQLKINIPKLQEMGLEQPFAPDYGFKIELVEESSSESGSWNHFVPEVNDYSFSNSVRGFTAVNEDDNVFYRGANGKIQINYKDNGGYKHSVIWHSNNVHVESELIAVENKIFYFDINRRVRYIEWNGFDWVSKTPIYNENYDSKLNAVDGDIALEKGSYNIYYRGKNGMLQQYFKSDSTYTHANIGSCDGNNYSIHSASKILAKNGKVFYFDNDRLLKYYEWNSSDGWCSFTPTYDTEHINDKKFAGIGMAIDQEENIYYRGQDGKAQSFSICGSNYCHSYISTSNDFRIHESSRIIAHEDKVFFFSQDQNFTVFQKNSTGSWSSQNISLNDTRRGNGKYLTHDSFDNNLFYRNSDSGKINQYSLIDSSYLHTQIGNNTEDVISRSSENLITFKGTIFYGNINQDRLNYYQYSRCSMDNAQQEEDSVESFAAKLYPNPILDSNLTILLSLNENANVSIQIFNISGQLIHTLERSSFISGSYTLYYVLPDITNGVYFIKIKANDNTELLKLIKL